MDILLAVQGIDYVRWQTALGGHLPQARIRRWTQGDRAPADYVLFWKESPEALNPRERVKALFNLGAGVDALLAVVRRNPDCLAAKVPVIRLEDAGMAAQMVEYAVYCALRFLRRFHDYETQARQGIWQPLEVRAAGDLRVGVLGAGQLGLPVARALAQLGFGVRVFSRTPRALPALECFAGMEQLGEFAAGLDLAINLLPNTPETAGILEHSFFGRMARGAAIVNLARGAHVVDADLLAALESGQLARAALMMCSVKSLCLPRTHSGRIPASRSRRTFRRVPRWLKVWPRSPPRSKPASRAGTFRGWTWCEATERRQVLSEPYRPPHCGAHTGTHPAIRH